MLIAIGGGLLIGCSTGGTSATTAGSSTSGGSTGGSTTSVTTSGGSTNASTGGSTGGASTSGTTSGGSPGTTSGGVTSSSSSGGSTGAGTTSGGDAGCVAAVNAPYQFDACTPGDTNPCGCGMACAIDTQLPAGGGCEFLCTTTADCPDPSTTCQNGYCEWVPCGNGNNGSVGTSCTAETTNDGTCYGAVAHDSTAGLCVRNGTSAGPCLWPSQSATPALTCPAQQTCGTFYNTAYYLPLSTAVGDRAAGNAPLGSYYGICLSICSDTVACPSGQSCLLQNLGATEFASGCEPVTDGGCLTEPLFPEFNGCGADSDCSCPARCTADPLFLGQSVCEAPCTQDTDCPNAGDACVSGSCTFRLCGLLPDGGQATGSAQNGPCTVIAANDGTCIPNFMSFQLGSFGTCYLGGTATSTCDPTAPYDAGALCATGSLCVAGSCLPVCDPSGAACAGGATCIALNYNSASGVCVGP